jgi:mono/diheme cytochrome c family protein
LQLGPGVVVFCGWQVGRKPETEANSLRLRKPRATTTRATIARASLVATLATLVLLGTPLRADDAAVPPPPADPAAAKAYAVLDGACAGCHQNGKLKILPQPAANLGNILDLSALSRMPSLVRPGLPDASPLYTSIHARAMPPEGAGDELTISDLTAVRDWIEQLPEPTCTDRPPVTPEAITATLTSAAIRLGPERARTTRFLSLATFHNACATNAEMESARAGLAYLVNALSLGLDPVKLQPSGPAGVLLEVDLPAIGWTAERWDRLTYRAPAAAFAQISAALQKSLGTRVPVVDAGWFADATTQAPNYYDSIGMPETLSALLASLRIDPTPSKRDEADRIGLTASAVARGNRLIERRAFANGAAWFSREFAPTAGRPDLIEQTIAAANVTNRPTPQPQPDATLLHFDLPNGFPAYFAANASGARVNDLPGSLLRDDAHPSHKVAAAQSCLGCHAMAPAALGRKRTDDLKARIQADTSLSKETREKLLAGHREPAEWLKRLDEDAARFSRVLAAAGIEPGRKLDGLEPLPALIARYKRPVTAVDIAALAGVPPQRVIDLGKAGSIALADVTARLAFGPVPRDAVDAVLPEMAQRLGLDNPGGPPPATSTVVPSTAPELVLKAERSVFQSGDLLAIAVRASTACHLTLLTLDQKGRATVLYPNEFDADPTLEAGREVRFPSEKAPYQFRLREKGTETLIGVCTPSAKTADGIRHDYEKQRFTELGDYRAFLNRSWGSREGSDGKPAPRGRGARKPADSTETVPPAAKHEPQLRAAIRIKIE